MIEAIVGSEGAERVLLFLAAALLHGSMTSRSRVCNVSFTRCTSHPVSPAASFCSESYTQAQLLFSAMASCDPA